MNLRKKKRPADWPKQGFYFCMHHKVKCEYTHNIDERWDYQCAEKSYHELEVRLNAMRPVKGELPAELIVLGDKLDAAQDKHYAAWVEHYAANAKRNAIWDELNAEYVERDAAWAKLAAAQIKLDAVWDKLTAALIIKYAPEIDALFAIECDDVPWGDDGLIFQEEKE